MSNEQNEEGRASDVGDTSRKRRRLQAAPEAQEAPLPWAAKHEVELLEGQLESLRAQMERQDRCQQLRISELEAESRKLKRQVKYVLGEEDAARKELQEAEAKRVEDNIKAQDQVAALRTQNERLQLQLQGQQGQVAELEIELREARSQLAEAGGMEGTLEELHEQLQTTTGLLEEAEHERDQARTEVDHLSDQLAEKQMALAKLEEQAWQEGSTELRRRVQELEHSLRKKDLALAAEQRKKQDAQALQARVDGLESELDRTKRACEDAAAVQAERDFLLDERASWAGIFRGLAAEDRKMQSFTEGAAAVSPLPEGSAPTPTQAMALLLKIQQERTTMLLQWNLLEKKYANASREAERLGEDAESARKRAEAAERDAAALRDTLEARDQHIYSLELSKTGLKDIMKRFDEDPRKAAHDDEQREALEHELNVAQGELESLRDTLLQRDETAAEQREALDKLTAQLREVEGERDRLRRELQKAEDQLGEHEHKVAKGDYDKATTKVLHFVHNPADEAHALKAKEGKQAEVAKLRAEVAGLTRELQALREKSGLTDADSPGNGQAAVVSADGTDKDKMNRRLKEMFRERIHFFREACYMLTGWKIDMTMDIEHPQLRLRSMYAEAEQDSLLFQWGKDGLQLMETPFAKTLQRKILTFLSTCNSIPAFTSNLTLELFEKQTFQGA